jgi:serine phosphatase RsbU (regulator of sigma subunit)
MAGYLEDSGFEVFEAENGERGVELFHDRAPHIVLCDLRMPKLSGLEVLERLVASSPETPIIIVSGTGDISDAIRALKHGAWDYITKPIQDLGVLEHAINKALDQARLTRENREYREHLERTNARLEASLRKLEEDEWAARRIQFQLLPESPYTCEHYEFERLLKTSTYLSGDFVDYFRIDANYHGFYIADVSGHGVSSAFITVLLKSTMNYYLEQYRGSENNVVLDPSTVLKLLNGHIAAQDLGKYLTMFYGVLDERDNTLHYANGGQFPEPILTDGTEAQFIEAPALPVGLFEDAAYESRSLALPEAFCLVMFSDGVFEIMEQDSLHERKNALRSMVDSAATDVRALARALDLESRDVLIDDVTLLVVRKGD